MRRRAPNPRADWEYADGPTAGEDVPITSEPREEAAPGVPSPPKPEDDATSGNGGRTEMREVRAEDPELSPATNARLTDDRRRARPRPRRAPAREPRRGVTASGRGVGVPGRPRDRSSSPASSSPRCRVGGCGC